MFGIDIFLILTHFLAFVLGAICMILFHNFTDWKTRQSNHSHHSHGENGLHHNIIGIPAKKSTKNQDSQSTSVQKVQEHNPSKENSIVSESVPQQKKLSPKEWKNIQRKEDRARKKQEENDRKAALAEAKRKQAFNPLISKPADVVYQALAVSDGKLCPCEIGQTQYYRCWEYEGRLFYEFYCDKSKAAKAVNNRSAILDPFCIKNPNSVPVDNAKSMTIEEFGEMDKNFNIISKSTIKFE